MRVATGFILLALMLPLANGQTTEPSAQFSQWLADLGSDSWQVRDEAEEQLVRYGPDGIPAIEKLISQTSDLEVRSRAGNVLRRIGEDPLYPTFITLHLDRTPAREAFAKIAAAAGVQLPAERTDLWTTSLPPVTVDVDRQPFWSVVADACRQTGLTVSLDLADLRTVELVPGKIGNPSASTAILGMAPVKTPLLYTAAEGTVLNMKFCMFAEPGQRVLDFPIRGEDGGNSPWSFEEAVDASGHEHFFDDPSMRDVSSAGHWVNASLHIDNGPRQLARLRVKAAVVLQTAAARMEVDDFADLTTAMKTDWGIAMTVTRKAPLNPDTWEVDVRIQPGGLTRDQADLINRYFKEAARLLDADGRPFFVASSVGITATDGSLNRHIVFSRHGVASRYPRGEPARLVIEIPLGEREISVPLTWTDVALTP